MVVLIFPRQARNSTSDKSTNNSFQILSICFSQLILLDISQCKILKDLWNKRIDNLCIPFLYFSRILLFVFTYDAHTDIHLIIVRWWMKFLPLWQSYHTACISYCYVQYMFNEFRSVLCFFYKINQTFLKFLCTYRAFLFIIYYLYQEMHIY